MDFISTVLGRILGSIFSVVGNYGVSIILLTVLVRLLIFPLSMIQIRSTAAIQEIQPKIKEIQKKYPKQKEKQAQLTMELYKTHKINPAMGCLPLLIQLPIMWGILQVLREPAKYVFAQGADEIVSQGFLWMSSLALPDVIVVGGIYLPYILPLIASAATYFDAKYMMAAQQAASLHEDGTAMMGNMNKMMLYMMPLMILIYGRQMPAGLSLYWGISTLLGIAQRRFFDSTKRR